MASKPKMHVWTDADLDGAGSYLTLTWLLGSKFPYTVSPSNTFRAAFLEWQKLHKISDYEKIFILDLDVSENVDIVDHPNVVIIDHHSSHFPNKGKYTKATVIVEEETSACKLLYKKFHKVVTEELTHAQKQFILHVDDYDSYQFQLNQTRGLNVIFWNYQGDRVEKLAERFKNGFTGFTTQEKSIIDFYQKRLARIVDELEIFTTVAPISEKQVKFVATFVTEFLNDVAEYVLKVTGADVALVINTKTNKVSFRRSKSSTVNVSKLAERLAEGGGHEFSAGGILTEKVLEFSKVFKPFTKE